MGKSSVMVERPCARPGCDGVSRKSLRRWRKQELSGVPGTCSNSCALLLHYDGRRLSREERLTRRKQHHRRPASAEQKAQFKERRAQRLKSDPEYAAKNRAYQAKYREHNREKIRAKSREYHSRPEIKAKQAVYVKTYANDERKDRWRCLERDRRRKAAAARPQPIPGRWRQTVEVVCAREGCGIASQRNAAIVDRIRATGRPVCCSKYCAHLAGHGFTGPLPRTDEERRQYRKDNAYRYHRLEHVVYRSRLRRALERQDSEWADVKMMLFQAKDEIKRHQQGVQNVQE